jgi:hypothetical protein
MAKSLRRRRRRTEIVELLLASSAGFVSGLGVVAKVVSAQ